MKVLAVGCVLFWAATLVSLCDRRDIEIHRKLSWVVTLLVLNALGALLYLAFGPRREEVPGNADETIDPDAEPYTPAAASWNPLTGQNRLAAGQGLNASDGRGEADGKAGRPTDGPSA